MAWKIGQKVRVRAFFTVENVATDPDEVTLSVKAPNGTVTTYTGADLTNENPDDDQLPATGWYYRDVVLTAAGEWYYRWLGSGVCEAADEGRERVDPSPFA